MGVYAFVIALGYMLAFAGLKQASEGWHADWRTLWAGLGIGVLVLAALAFVFVREPGEALGKADGVQSSADVATSLEFWQAMRTPAFWIFGLATSLYGLIAAGVFLFCQSILKERNFDEQIFHNVMIISPLVALIGNLVSGWLAVRWPMGRLLAIGMGFVTIALVALPLLVTEFQVYLYAVAIGLAGGAVSVVFYGIWREAFGPVHLGKIQGAAQMMTVVASAFGPLMLAGCKEAYGSYVPMFEGLAVAAAVLGLCAWWVPLPRPRVR